MYVIKMSGVYEYCVLQKIMINAALLEAATQGTEDDS